MTRFFLSFTKSHRKVFNTMVCNNPGLMSGSFLILVHNPKVLDCTRLDHVNSMATFSLKSKDLTFLMILSIVLLEELEISKSMED
ncbi:hypothetical protein BY996DRAFT_7321809 [Phakopsora pachyrhizi]|nr:hypothetical protein BY996DRAFT_7321809 [Phakopsora pachyrhizi]